MSKLSHERRWNFVKAGIQKFALSGFWSSKQGVKLDRTNWIQWYNYLFNYLVAINSRSCTFFSILHVVWVFWDFLNFVPLEWDNDCFISPRAQTVMTIRDKPTRNLFNTSSWFQSYIGQVDVLVILNLSDRFEKYAVQIAKTTVISSFVVLTGKSLQDFYQFWEHPNL